MKSPLKFGTFLAALALNSTTVQALDILHIANANSPDYQAFVEARFDNTDEDPSNDGTWTHVGNGTGAGMVGGLLSRSTTFTGLNGGEMTVKEYLESFDLIIIGNGIGSANFTDTSGWSALAKPLLVHSALVSRASSNGIATDRLAMFTGGQSNFTYGNPADTLPATPTSTLREAIFNGVGEATDLYSNVASAFAEANLSTTTFGGGELVSSLVNITSSAHGVVFWNAGSTNAVGQVQAAKRGYMVLKNLNDSSSTLTSDGKQVLSNLIDQLLVESAPIFLPPSNLVAKTGVSSINLSWTASAGAVSYNVKRSAIQGSGHVAVSTSGAVTGNTFTDTGLTNGTTYYYVVSAVNAASTETINSNEASATPVAVIQPSIDILYIANTDSTAYRNFGTNGQFSDNTWTHKGTGLTGDNLIGGDLDRTASFTGIHGGTDVTVRSYLESFDLIIVSVPSSSANFLDDSNGTDWAELTKPVVFHSAVVSRALGGRPGMFSGDNFLTITLAAPTDTTRVSSSALSNALFAGVTTPTDLYGFLTADVLAGTAGFGTGEQITSLNDATNHHFGLVFWAATDITGSGGILAGNRAFLPLKGNVDDLNADGKLVLANLINQIQLPQVTPANPYGGWAALNISAVDPLALPGFNVDAENDGVSNGLEWVLGGDPLTNDPGTVLPVSTGNAAAGLTLVFNRAAGSVTSTTLSVDWSTNLSGFPNSIPIGASDVGPSGNAPTVDIDAPSPGKVTVNIPAANAAGGKVFARLKAQRNP